MDLYLEVFKEFKSILEKKLFFYSNWKNNCSNRNYFSWTMNIQIIKNYWDMEIIGNRRKKLLLISFIGKQKWRWGMKLF